MGGEYSGGSGRGVATDRICTWREEVKRITDNGPSNREETSLDVIESNR